MKYFYKTLSDCDEAEWMLNKYSINNKVKFGLLPTLLQGLFLTILTIIFLKQTNLYYYFTHICTSRLFIAI